MINEASSNVTLKHGEIVKSGPNAGWVYLEFNKRALYVAPENSPGLPNAGQADKLAAQASARVPMDEEMAFILSEEVRNLPGLRGTFETAIGTDADLYRTSTPVPDCLDAVFYRHGSDGRQDWDGESAETSLRLVRG